MANAVVTFSAGDPGSLPIAIASYNVSWVLNGGVPVVASVPQSDAGDSSGYATDFASANPGTTLAPGDVIGVSVASVGTDGATSAEVPSVPASVTVPPVTPPSVPAPPTNVVLALSA
jgi:hypothetical protein